MTSNTGLMASPKKNLQRKYRPPVELSCMVNPAPYTLRPFAGLYNPFSYGCSILCNHPADSEIKDVVKRAKDALASEYKMDMPIQELVNIRATLHKEKLLNGSTVDFVPEELFRRYTETDSRPLTPAPTLASAVSKSSIRRRCLTPDEPLVAKKTLVLDLRRSHSQETLCWHGFCTSDITESNMTGSNILSTNLSIQKTQDKKGKDGIPLVSPVVFSTRSPFNRGNVAVKTLQKGKNTNPNKPNANLPADDNGEEIVELPQECVEDQEIEIREVVGGEIRRRGKRKKGRNRLMSAALVNATQNDPETQIAGIGSESHNPSSRGSIIQNEDNLLSPSNPLLESKLKKPSYKSFIEPEILKILHREIELDTIEVEFDPQRRFVLEEVLKTRPEKTQGKEMQDLMKEWKLPPVSLNKWLHLPRIFSRRNALFSLPVDRRQLENLSPMKYVSNFVKVSSNKQLLYQTVMRQFNPDSFYIEIENISKGLGLMMGETMNEKNLESFHSLLQWEHLTGEEISNLIMDDYRSLFLDKYSSYDYVDVEKDDLFENFGEKDHTEEAFENQSSIHFQIWCGLCALCERLNGPLLSPASDPAHEIELADFDTFAAKLTTVKINENLLTVLTEIQHSHTLARGNII